MTFEGNLASPRSDWYRPLAAHLRSAYLRYAFTKGTAAEVDFLVHVLGIKEGSRVLDVGCGPGRHLLELARRGADVVGVDISSDFLDVARTTAKDEGLQVALFEMDAADMPFDSEFDAVISICEGAFGLGLDDLKILRAMKRAMKRGSKVAVGAANLFYVLTHMKESGRFDPTKMLFSETVEAVIGEDGSKDQFEMWNSCYTPRELEWIANGAGMDPMAVYGVEPGKYSQQLPGSDHPELLLIAERPK
ncbi:MAG TPA: class I SAM-dependent methyltransferase [Actinomycetota bacterium]|nr:class I SAM-dependent methyltransferase [Actinomycetota bacterium]